MSEPYEVEVKIQKKIKKKINRDSENRVQIR